MSEVVDVQIKDENTPWNTIVLDDGTAVRMRLNVLGVQRALEKWNAAGDPIYRIQHDVTQFDYRSSRNSRSRNIHKANTQEAKEIK
ncbi:MAG: hypothetical protein V3W22_05370 [Thermoplasmata archaeon]